MDISRHAVSKLPLTVVFNDDIISGVIICLCLCVFSLIFYYCLFNVELVMLLVLGYITEGPIFSYWPLFCLLPFPHQSSCM